MRLRYLWQFFQRDLFQKSIIGSIFRLIYRYAAGKNQPLIKIFNIPKRFLRRQGDITANLIGLLSPYAVSAHYSLNEGDWIPVGRGGFRISFPLFVVELPVERLLDGINQLKIKAVSERNQDEILSHTFEYDSTEVTLPIVVEWSNPNCDLDVQDGVWETCLIDGQWRVRPTPGFEDFDRILNVTGAFSGGRRVETNLIFRRNIWWMQGGIKDFGFGIISMWGGHPDFADVSPRRGWRFGLGWYWQRIHSVRLAFSQKLGSDKPIKTVKQIPFQPQYNVCYFIIIECREVQNKLGQHLYYEQRMKWWKEGENEPTFWISNNDLNAGQSIIAPGEYAVALLAHRAQVDFGVVKVDALAPLIVS